MRYEGRHRSQYAAGASLRLRAMGCTPTSLANAIRCATGGSVNLSGDQVLAKVPSWEETNPATPGWSLADASLAASRIGGSPPFAVRQGSWADVVTTLQQGYGVVLQGDSDQFLTGCSGTFDGDHAVFVHPDQVTSRQRLGDPICADWRSETLTTLQRYAEKLSGLQVRYGVVQAVIPPLSVTPPDTGTQPPEEPMQRHIQETYGTVTTVRQCKAMVLTEGTDLQVGELMDLGPNGIFPSLYTADIDGMPERCYVAAVGGTADLTKGYLLAFAASDVAFAFYPAADEPVSVTLGSGLYRVA